MPEELIHISYRFTLPKNEIAEFSLDFSGEGYELQREKSTEFPAWTALENHQCSHCPLKAKEHPQCPLAAALEPIVEATDKLFSYDEVKVEAILPQRTVSVNTTAQRGISSLMGLIIPTSGCPHSEFFKPMARFHLPFSDENDTIYRVTSMYLLAMYIKKEQGSSVEVSFEGLNEIYENLRIVNLSISERLREISKKDSSLNAIVLLDMFTMLLPLSIESSLEDIMKYFSAYLPSGSSTPIE